MDRYSYARLLVSLLLISLVLVGCGGGASEPTRPTEPPPKLEPSEDATPTGAPPSSASDPETTAEEPEPVDEPAPSEGEEDSIEGPGEDQPLSPPEPDIPVPEGADLIACPEPGSTMILKFSANIEITTQEAVITHVLHDGILSLQVSAGEGGAAAVTALAASSIPYEMNGTMGPCTLAGGGTMTPSADGYCEAGVVYLTIVEDWGPYDGTLTCPDAQMPLSAPSMGQQTHSGADGRGEIFFLDANFSGEGAGYTTIRPFAGPMGQGDHIWTLFYDYTGPVGP
jgi:hypothetical protein